MHDSFLDGMLFLQQEGFIEPQNATFYYDETENIGSLYLRDDDFNEGTGKCFVLGGVYYSDVFQGKPLNELKKAIRLQRDELKFSSLCKSGSAFCKCIGGAKLNRFLRWLTQTNLSVHYTVVDYLYFAITDIVDSIECDLCVRSNFFLKSKLYEIFKSDYRDVYGHLSRYDYPNIQSEDIDAFCSFFIDKIDKCGNPDLCELREVFLAGKQQANLPFLSDNPTRTILKDLSDFYLMRINMLRNSSHVFDKILPVEALIEENPFLTQGCKSYKFVISQNEELIQVADCVVGLIGKFFEYLTSTDFAQVRKDIEGFNTCQQESWRLFTNYMRAAELLGFSTSVKYVDPQVIEVLNGIYP